LAQQYTSSSVNSNVFVTYNNGQYGIVGLAYLGVVCNPNQQIRSNIDVWIGSDLLSGLVLYNMSKKTAGFLSKKVLFRSSLTRLGTTLAWAMILAMGPQGLQGMTQLGVLAQTLEEWWITTRYWTDKQNYDFNVLH